MAKPTLLLWCILLISLPLSGEEVAPGVLRTPEERFVDLVDFPFEPHYLQFNGVRVHFLDEGPESGQPILLLHGLPTWSYLYRNMIPALTEAGHRVIVPDLIGFGKSDKFANKTNYSYVHHIETIKYLVHSLDLHGATFFGQDWGGMIGLRVVAEMQDRFARVAVSNTGMVAREGITGWLIEKVLAFMIWWNGPVTFEELKLAADQALHLDNPSATDGARMFSKWMAHSYYADDLNIAGVITTFGRLELSDAVAHAYEAPYPSGEYKAGVHVLASLIPTQLSENEHYWRTVYEQWDKPFLVTFGSEERITIRMKQEFMDRVPSPIEIDLESVGHFSQEEAGPELSSLLIKFIAGQLDQANSSGGEDRH